MLDDSNLTVTETTRIGPSAGNSVMPLVKSNCADVPSELREPAVIRNRRRKNAQPRNITDRYEVSDVTYYDEYDDSSVGIMTSQLWPTGSFDTDNDDVSSDANIDEMDAEDRSTAHTCDTEVLDLSVKAMRKSEERVIEKKELVVDEHGVLDLTARGSASRRENSITVAGQPASSRNSSADWNGNSSEGNKYGADHRSERTHLNKREEGGYRDSAIADMLTMYGYQEYAELSQFGPYTSRSANNIFFVTNSMSHPGSSISYSVNSSMSNQLPLASSAAASHSKIFSVASPPSPSDDDPHSLSFSSSEGTTDLAMRPPNDFTMKVSSQSPSNRQQQQVSALTGMGLTHANNSKSSLTHKIINSVQRLAKSNHAKTAVHNLATSSSYIQACFDPHMAPKVADAVSSSGLRGVLPDYSKYLKRYLSSDECGKRECRELGYREHFHCLDCKSRVIGKKEDMVRHYKWHKKRDDSLQHGFMRYSPRDDCSKKYSACAHNGRQTHYHCLQVGCNKVYISTSDVQMHSNYHRKDSAIIQEGFQRFRATEDCGSQSCTFYGQRTTHFHCRRSGCNFTFKNKADMEKHKIYHQRDEALTRDGFKKFMKYENCQFSNCRYSKLTNHIHCIRPGCNYVLHSTGQLFSHKRKHERRNLELTYKQLHGKKAGKGMFHVPAVRRNNVVNRAFNFAHPIKGIAVNNPYSSLIGYPPVTAFAQQEEGDFEESDETGTSNHMSAMDDVDPYDCEPATNQVSNMDDMDLYDSGTNQLSAMDDTDLYDSDSSESRDLVIDENISKAKLSGRAKQETDDSLTFNKFNIKEENPHSQYDSIKTVANIETTAKNKNKEAANTNIKTATKTKNKFASLKGETEAAKLNALVMKTNGTETNFDAKFMADVENSEKDDEFENKDDDLENKDNDVSSNKDCSSANSHLTSPENKPRSSQLDVKVDSTDKDDEISESKSPIEMEELGSDPVVKSLSPQMAVAPADFVPKASPAVNGKRERDETWKKYLTRFTANDPCHAQCPFLYKDHYHCNTSTCRVLFRSKDGVRDHARCHQQQDQVTTMSYDIFEANTACHNESCQLSCAKKHYHCRWPGCAQVLSDDDGPFSRLEHNKIHMFARSNVMKRSPTSIPNYLSSISTDSGSVGTASGTISDILPLNNRRRGRPPKYPKNDIPVIPKPNMTEAEIQERAKATGDPIIASGFRRYASDESCPDEQCIYASSEHYHCVRERCHHSTNHRDVLNLHARDFHSHITILDGFEFFDREIDCRRSHCNNNRVNRHFHCTRSRCDYSFVRYSTMIQHDRKHASPDSVGVLPHMTSGSSKIFGNDARSGVQGATDDISQKFGVYNQRIGAGAILNNMTRVSSMVPQIKPGLLPANTTSLISDSSAKLFSASRHRAIAPKPIQPLTVAVGISPLAVSTGTLYNNEHSAPVLQNSKMHFSTTENCGRPFCKLKKRDHFHCSLCNQAFSDNARLSHHWSKHVNKANITDYNTPSSSSYGIYNESNINEDWADGINDEDGDEEEEEEEEGDLSKMWFQSAVSRSQSLNLDPNTFSGLSHSLTLNPHSFSGLVGNPLLGGIDMSSNHGNLGNSNFGDSSAVDLSGKIRSVKTSPQLQVLKSQSQAVLANFSQQKLAKREALWLTSVEDNGGIESSGSRYSDDEEIASKFPSSAINSVNLLQPMRRRLAPDMSEQNPSKMRKVVTDRLQQHLSMKRAAIGSPSHNLSIIPSNHNSPITAGVNSNLFSINTFNQ